MLNVQLKIMKACLSQMKKHLWVHMDHMAKLWDLEIFQKTFLEEQIE